MNSIGKIRPDRKNNKPGNQNDKKNNLWIFQAKNGRNCQRENLDNTSKGKPPKRNWISSDKTSSRPIILKRKRIITNKIDYVETNMKGLII